VNSQEFAFWQFLCDTGQGFMSQKITLTGKDFDIVLETFNEMDVIVLDSYQLFIDFEENK
jgi:hypothetical protein